MDQDQEVQQSTKSPEDIKAWCSRVKTIQLERATPEVRLRIQEASERQQQAKYAAKKCHQIQKVNYISSASNVSALSSWKKHTESGTREEQQMAYQQHAAMQTEQTTKLQNIMKSALAPKSAPLPPPASSSAGFFSFKTAAQARAEESEEDEEDMALNELENEVVMTSAQAIPRAAEALQLTTVPVAAADFDGFNDEDEDPFATAASPAGTAVNADLMALLDQLRVEPTDNAEMEAKFKLFENFLGTVTAVRDTTLQFWEDNKLVFIEGPMRNAAAKQVRDIDSHDACGIEDDATKWFVYLMLVKANQNSARINQVLASLRSRLDILAQAPGDCPICLEAMEASKCTILSCAHKVCSDCWDHYCALMRQSHYQLLCPLCRHEEFVTQLAQSN